MAAGQAAEQAAIFTLVVLYNLLVLTQRNGDSSRHGETNQSFHGAWSQSLSLCLSCSQAVVRNDNPNDLCGRLNDEATTFRGCFGYFLIRHTRCNRQQNDT